MLRRRLPSLPGRAAVPGGRLGDAIIGGLFTRTMAATEIPKRTSFRPAEVCAIAGVPAYVLRSWEAEFPKLCGTKNAKGAHVYGRPEVELVVQIKELVFGEGLTLGAARKKLEGGPDEELPRPELPLDDMLGADVRQKLAAVRQGLQVVLEMLSTGNGAGQPAPVAAVAAEPAPRGKTAAPAKKPRRKSARSKAQAPKTAAAKTMAKRKRRTA